jgi:hypothetical protein
MPKQNVVVHCHRGAQYHNRSHGLSSAHSYGHWAANGQVAKDHVDLALQRGLHVRTTYSKRNRPLTNL